MPTAPSALPLLGAPQAPGDKPNLAEGSKSQGENLQAPRHTRPDPCPRQHGRPKCYPAHGEARTEINLSPDWSKLELLILVLLPYLVDGLAHYAEKIGDTQQRFILKIDFFQGYSTLNSNCYMGLDLADRCTSHLYLTICNLRFRKKKYHS